MKQTLFLLLALVISIGLLVDAMQEYDRLAESIPPPGGWDDRPYQYGKLATGVFLLIMFMLLMFAACVIYLKPVAPGGR